ncbi:tetratricopeptide repeat protein [Pseudoduganella albidiflava]|uniref:Sel1 repeat family protein n=2 Tax=Pseudoduganella albidiflava TaxID=321983 RepID=A0ABX5RSJ4_9BURK|nr:tetratricopeptide repeat protein [Pseudoduganella albidiflava]QBI01582.1 sel1 repeat family protein [Pseudoduganella albidiflava]
MKHSIIPVTCLFVALMGGTQISHFRKELAMETMPSEMVEFKVTDPSPECDSWRRHMPKYRDPRAYRIYMEARKLWRSKIGWQLSRGELTIVLNGVRNAAEMGDWGAQALMSKFYLRGLGVLDTNRVLAPAPDKAIAILRSAAALGQPWAIYDLGVAHQYGYGGVRPSETLAWAHFLRAAKLGSPEAQMVLANAYSAVRAFDKEEKMLQCAYRQRHGEAAQAFAMYHSVIAADYLQAIKYFQNGVEYGNHDSAAALRRLYADGFWSYMGEKYKPAFEKLGIKADAERSRRYEEIAAALEINPDLKLTRLNEVLPLPPTKLPPWNGVVDALEVEREGPPIY